MPNTPLVMVNCKVLHVLTHETRLSVAHEWPLNLSSGFTNFENVFLVF
jgi:hypothetical protein